MARVLGGRKGAAPMKNSLVVEEHEIAVPQRDLKLMARLPQQFGEAAVGTIEARGSPRLKPQRRDGAVVVMHRIDLTAARQLNQRALGVELGVLRTIVEGHGCARQDIERLRVDHPQLIAQCKAVGEYA